MKAYLVKLIFLLMVLAVSGCDQLDRSFSTFVRDVIDNPERSKPVSTIEGKDFHFTRFDELENYNDLLNR